MLYSLSVGLAVTCNTNACVYFLVAQCFLLTCSPNNEFWKWCYTDSNRYVILIVCTPKLVWTLPCLWVCVSFVLSSLGITGSRKHGSLLWQIHSWTGGHASAGCKTRYCIILIFLLVWYLLKASVMSISWSQPCKKALAVNLSAYA